MDDIGRKSGHLMLITPERVFYAGLLGRPRQRCSGGFNIYVALEGGLWLTTADGRKAMAKWSPCCRTSGTPSPAITVRCSAS
jgi:hypothetical protein